MTNPTPKALAAHLKKLAQLLEQNGDHALELVDALASRGLPSNTLGSGSRSATDHTSVEIAAGANRDTPLPPDQWQQTEQRFNQLLDVAYRTGFAIEKLLTEILNHASDQDWLPAGSGNCLCCTKFCRPDLKRPDNRLRAGFCPACHQAWIRWHPNHPSADRFVFIRERRAALEAAFDQRMRQKHATGTL